MPGDRTLPQLAPAKLSTAEVNLFLAGEFPLIRSKFAWRRVRPMGCELASGRTSRVSLERAVSGY